MSYFVRSGNGYSVASKTSFVYENNLPAGTYVIKQDLMSRQFRLEIVDDFSVTHKLYGNTISNAERIINTFNSRPNSTGIMLCGEKGSGKTLLAKMISIMCRESNIPTIIINEPHCGDDFNTFLQTIDQECVVIFDEFEKVYGDRKAQEAVLTLLDGVYPSKKMFILTVNDKFRIDTNMKNRPGRIYYMLDFNGLELDFIREYCMENLNNKNHIESICKVSQIFDSFNFDMLKAVVEEMNRYNESVNEVMKFINTKPEFNNGTEYDVEIKLAKTQSRIDGIIGDYSLDPEEVFADNMKYTRKRTINPLSLGDDGIDFSVYFQNGRFDNLGYHITFVDNDLIDINQHENSFTYLNGDGDKLILKKAKKTHFAYAF
jgi:hypothetical protein